MGGAWVRVWVWVRVRFSVRVRVRVSITCVWTSTGRWNPNTESSNAAFMLVYPLISWLPFACQFSSLKVMVMVVVGGGEAARGL